MTIVLQCNTSVNIKIIKNETTEETTDPGSE